MLFYKQRRVLRSNNLLDEMSSSNFCYSNPYKHNHFIALSLATITTTLYQKMTMSGLILSTVSIKFDGNEALRVASYRLLPQIGNKLLQHQYQYSCLYLVQSQLLNQYQYSYLYLVQSIASTIHVHSIVTTIYIQFRVCLHISINTAIYIQFEVSLCISINKSIYIQFKASFLLLTPRASFLLHIFSSKFTFASAYHNCLHPEYNLCISLLHLLTSRASFIHQLISTIYIFRSLPLRQLITVTFIQRLTSASSYYSYLHSEQYLCISISQILIFKVSSLHRYQHIYLHLVQYKYNFLYIQCFTSASTYHNCLLLIFKVSLLHQYQYSFLLSAQYQYNCLYIQSISLHQYLYNHLYSS